MALAYIAFRRGEWEAVLEHARECEAALVGADSRLTRSFLSPLESAAQLGLGRVDEALSRAERGLAESRASGNEGNEGVLESVRGEILAAQGHQAEALAACDRGIAILERLGARPELEHARARRAAVAGPLC